MGQRRRGKSPARFTLSVKRKKRKGEHLALIQCHECGKEISDSAATCPGCGAPVRAKQHKKGDTVPYTDQEVAVMLSKKKKISHILHLLLSIITAGIWIIIWVLVAISNTSENAKIDRQIKKGKKI